MTIVRILTSAILLSLTSLTHAKPCYVPHWRNEVICASLARPLNPEQPQGPQIDVHYAIAPALARRKQADPIFFIAGGPGQSAISIMGPLMPLLARLNNRRDLIFVDQRGTGRSAPLLCPSTTSQAQDTAAQLIQLKACQQNLTKLPYIQQPDHVRFFTTPIAMQDLDAIRRELGFQKINLLSASYGTRAALDYQRQFPQAVRRNILDGVAPPDMALPASMSSDTQTVLNAVFTQCETHSACQSAHPQLRIHWSKLLNSLPQTITLNDPINGKSTPTTITRERLLSAVRTALYSPVWSTALPTAIEAAYQGRFQSLIGLASAMSTSKNSGIAMGMHFSVICSEDAPLLKQSQDTPGTDFAQTQSQLYQQACATWPQGSLPAAFYQIPPSHTPVLLLSAGLDPVTPPRHGEHVAKALGPLAKHIVVPNAGHGVMTQGCMPDILFQFINANTDTQALNIPTTCAEQPPRPTPFELIHDSN